MKSRDWRLPSCSGWSAAGRSTGGAFDDRKYRLPPPGIDSRPATHRQGIVSWGLRQSDTCPWLSTTVSLGFHVLTSGFQWASVPPEELEAAQAS